MERIGELDWEEILEWAVLALIVAVVALVAFWLVGWLMVVLGKVFLALSGLIVSLLELLVPVLIVVGLVYLVVRYFQQKR